MFDSVTDHVLNRLTSVSFQLIFCFLLFDEEDNIIVCESRDYWYCLFLSLLRHLHSFIELQIGVIDDCSYITMA